MASVVRSVGRHLPGLGSKHGSKRQASTRRKDGDEHKSSPSSSPFLSRRVPPQTSPLQSPLSHVSSAPSPGSTPAISASSSSLSDNFGQLAAGKSNSSSADCLAGGGAGPLSDSSLSLDPSAGGGGDLGAASMDLNKLLSGVERFQRAIDKLGEQFAVSRRGQAAAAAALMQSFTLTSHIAAVAGGAGHGGDGDGLTTPFSPDRTGSFSPATVTESDSSHFEERSIDDAIATARSPAPPGGSTGVSRAETPAGSSIGRSNAATPASPVSPTGFNSSSDWSCSSESRPLRSASRGSEDWASDDGSDAAWMPTASQSSATRDQEPRNQPNSVLIDSLREVVACIEAVLNEHVAMNGTELFLATRALYEQCIEHERLNPGDVPDFPEAIEAVSTAFTTCVADYAFGERASPEEDLHQLQESLIALSQAVESMESANRREEEAAASAAAGALAPGIPRYFLSEEVPKTLRRWCRYTKELANYYQKRVQHEVEQAQKLVKLARSTAEELSDLALSGLPCFASVQSGFTEDVVFSRHCIENYSLEMAGNVIQPLKTLTDVLDRARHDLQAQWQKECRKAEKRKMEALGTMYKARQQYITCCEEERKQRSSRSNPSINVIWSKVDSAEGSYKQAICTANEIQEQLTSLHESAFDHIAETAADAGKICTECINKATVSAQSLWGMRTVKRGQNTPVTSSQTLDLVGSLQGMVASGEVYEFEDASEPADDSCFLASPTQVSRKLHQTMSVEELAELAAAEPAGAGSNTASPKPAWSKSGERETEARTPPSPAAAARRRRHTMHVKTPRGPSSSGQYSRTDGIFSSRDSYTVNKPKASRKMSAPCASLTPEEVRRDSVGRKMSGLPAELGPALLSPAAKGGEQGTPSLSRRIMASLSADPAASGPNTPAAVRKLLGTESEKPAKKTSVFGPNMSSMAEMHEFQRLHGPAKCCHCESYVYFNGAECKQCGIACHRKCLQRLSAECFIPQNGQQRPGKIRRAMSTFGINITRVVERSSHDVPAIVPACIREIEERGLLTMGIYRLSGVKSKVEKLCQQFEKDDGRAEVKLGGFSPQLIACVLKLFFRQLPEPLFTYKSYSEFIRIGQEGFVGEAKDEEQAKKHQHTVQRYRTVLASLAPHNFYTAKMLITHLEKVAQHSSENNMTAGNLGIVFGPTLLQPKVKKGEASTTVRSLVDMPHQSKAIEFLIAGASEIFTSDLEPSTLRKVDSAEYLGSSSSLNGSEEDLTAPGRADTREGMVAELGNMCSLLGAVKDQRDIRAATKQRGSESCAASTDTTLIDGKLPRSTATTFLPGGIDLSETSPLTQTKKSQSTESGLGSIDESDLIQVVKKKQEERDHQAHMRSVLLQNQEENGPAEGLKQSSPGSSDPAMQQQLQQGLSPVHPLAMSFSGNMPLGDDLPPMGRKRKSSLPNPVLVHSAQARLPRSSTQASLGMASPGQLQHEEFHRHSTEEVIRQRRRIRMEGREQTSPALSSAVSHIASDMLLESTAGRALDSSRLDIILDRQDTSLSDGDCLPSVTSADGRQAENCYAVTPDLPSSGGESEEEDDEADDTIESIVPEPADVTTDTPNDIEVGHPHKGQDAQPNSVAFDMAGTHAQEEQKKKQSSEEVDDGDTRSISPLSFGDSDDDDSDVLSFLP